MFKKTDNSSGLFNIMVYISIAVFISLTLVFITISSHLNLASKNSIKYYSILVGESFNRNLMYSSKIDENEDNLLYYTSKSILEEIKDKSLDKLNVHILNELKAKHDLDGIAILTKPASYGYIALSTVEEEIGGDTKDWGYWNDAILELFQKNKVESVEEGKIIGDVWIGPKTYSYVDLDKTGQKNFYKYAYLSNKGQGYLINIFVKEDRYDYKDDSLDKVLNEFEEKTDFLKNIFLLNLDKLNKYLVNSGQGKQNSDPYVIHGFAKFPVPELYKEILSKGLDIYSDMTYPCKIDNKQSEILFTSIDDNIYVVSVLSSSFLKGSLIKTLGFIALVLIFTLLVIFLISKNHKSKTDEYMDRESSLRKVYEAKAYIDQLTKLPNRHKLDLDLVNIINEETPSTIFYMDLDGFKSINDNFGHDAGDFALYEIANLVRSTLDDEKEVYRVGGDEFVVISKLMTRKEAEDLAREVNSISTRNINYENHDFSLNGISIGIVNFPEEAKTKSEILKLADITMYKAKSKIANSFEFYNKTT